jgi:hypothetical protein
MVLFGIILELIVSMDDISIHPWQIKPTFVESARLQNYWVFSSPELKAQVSYSDRLLSVVRLSVLTF